jgi:protein-S-isoprenylcysteine O-methyltransferase Ste14
MTGTEAGSIGGSSQGAASLAPGLLVFGLVLVALGFIVIALSAVQIFLIRNTTDILAGAIIFAVGVGLLVWSWRVYS